MIKAWGDWTLFQELLALLRSIGDRHGGVSIANVATRWVLEQPAVGAVIIGECEISSNSFLAAHSVYHHNNPPPTPSRTIYITSLHISHPSAATWTTVAHLTMVCLFYLGVRMGIAEHKDDNKKVFSFSLTPEDNADIQAILARSNGDRLTVIIGDCGAEYR